MNNRYKLAKKQGLNWKALVIEDLQSYIKLEIRNGIIRGKSFDSVWRNLHKTILNETAEFDNEELRNRTINSLNQLARRTYAYLYRTLFGIGFSTLAIMQNISNGTSTIKEQNTFADRLKLRSVYKYATQIEVYAKDYQKALEHQIRELAKIEAKDRYDSRVNMRNIAEMTVRQEAHIQEMQSLIEDGVNLVWIEPHANCSKRCEPWQGKLYSLDNTYGKTQEGISYEPLSNATDIYEVTKSGRVYKNGCISGFNCRHRLLPYQSGSRPIEIPANVIKHQRWVNNTQRAMERKIRYYREIALQSKGINDKLYIEARNRANQANRDYILFSRKNEVPYYPDRTKVID